MQIRIFTIPVPGGEKEQDEMNAFLRASKVLQVDDQFISTASGSWWSFCVRFLETTAPKKARVDYREVLDESTFKRFSQLRQIRKKVAQEDGVPAYAVFTDEELAALARVPKLTAEAMQSVKGIGEKKLARYGRFFVEDCSQPVAKGEAHKQ